MNLYYNPLDKNCNKHGGTLKQGNSFKLKVYSQATYCNLIIENDKTLETAVYPMDRVDGGFSVIVKGLKKGLYFYYFDCGGQLFGRGKQLDSLKFKNLHGISKYQLTIYSKNYTVPSTLKGGLIYQIFPDRFNKGEDIILNGKIMRTWGEEPYYKPNDEGKILNNDFFGGNFKGIETKLDYLKDLGVNYIYLNPISLAYSNHRYDTANYLKIDPLLGDENSLKSLIKKANLKGIKFIFDGVYNHTGDDSIYFNKYGNFDSVGAYQSKNSKYYNWYSFQEYPKKYTCWWDINILPTINKNSKEFENYILNEVLPYYFSLGFEGVRLDVVDELPDTFVKKIRKKVKKLNPNAVIIGEVWEDATNKIAYGVRREYFQGGELDSVMNYPLKNAIIDFLLTGESANLKSTVFEQLNNYPKNSLNVLMNLLGTHDTARILTVLSGKTIPIAREEARRFKLTDSEFNLAVARLKVAFSIMFTLYGVPTLYYGDERGMQGCKDPFNRRCLDFDSVETEIFNFVKKLSKIRRKYNVFVDGETKILPSEKGVFAFERIKGDEKLTVVTNASNCNYNIQYKNSVELLSGEKKDFYTLNKYSVLILKRR